MKTSRHGYANWDFQGEKKLAAASIFYCMKEIMELDVQPGGSGWCDDESLSDNLPSGLTIGCLAELATSPNLNDLA
jgi:hypothetical protein